VLLKLVIPLLDQEQYILAEAEGHVDHKLLGVSNEASDCSGPVSVHTRP
jgi:hypothetical protein